MFHLYSMPMSYVICIHINNLAAYAQRDIFPDLLESVEMDEEVREMALELRATAPVMFRCAQLTRCYGPDKIREVLSEIYNVRSIAERRKQV